MHFGNCHGELTLLIALFSSAGYLAMRFKHLWHWLMRHKYTADSDGCCNYNHPGTCTLYLGDNTWHDGPGWYFVDDEYPDEGSWGAFETRRQATRAARRTGYKVNKEIGHAHAQDRRPA